MKSRQIRQSFLRFFEERGHAIVPSSPVVPLDDPTLMFTNAGMNQFKDVFLATGSRDFKRAADTQKCIRAGGKHNDLDDVGHDGYHHTFFEMLGNWSFGDYFKREAIEWAWELLTGVYGIPAERLHATYFAGDEADGLEPDLEARDLWREVTGINPGQVHAFGKKDNFWEMADTGPCGPCSEIHVDLTPDLSGSRLVNADDARVFELWNLVFIQFNRTAKGLAPLPARHVDTGMGLERLTTVLQGQRSNYDTDLFAGLLEEIRRVTGAPAYGGTLPSGGPGVPHTDEEQRDVAYRIVADHLRCLVFAITDGAQPGNEGRGYVVRRILRRAYRYGHQFLGGHRAFLHKLVPAVVEEMGDAFPELRRSRDLVAGAIREEEESFARTLDQGLRMFEVAATTAAGHHLKTIPAEVAFKLHDTYGFPFDLTTIIAAERGLEVDEQGFDELMEQARERARQGARGAGEDLARELKHAAAANEPAFFERTATDDGAKWETLELETEFAGWLDAEGRFHEGALEGPEPCAVLLRRTPFYSEAGGQVGDAGRITWAADGSEGGAEGVFEVLDTQKVQDTVLHVGRLAAGRLAPGTTVRAAVAAGRRGLITVNHTATHLLNLGLREVLGDHVQQKGSLVDDEKTRFDFSHAGPVTADEVERVERAVGERVAAGLAVDAEVVELDRALAIHGIRAVFGESYGRRVRVVSIGAPVAELLADPEAARWYEYSVELCGGNHLKTTDQVGEFALVAEEAVAKGIRRLVGLTGEAARGARAAAERLAGEAERLSDAAGEEMAGALTALRAAAAEATLPVAERRRLEERFETLQGRVHEHERHQAAAGWEQVRARAEALLAGAQRADGTAIVVGEIPGAPADQLRQAVDWLRQKAGSAAVLLIATSGEKITLLAGFSPDLVEGGLAANRLIREIAPLVGGSGGGRPDFAQGGGKDAARVPEALDRAATWLREQLS